MPENPNPSPAFIRSPGILGVGGVKLTNQVCTRDNPASTPVVIYDNRDYYSSGNGALIESVTVAATGPVNKSCLLMFLKFIQGATIQNPNPSATEWLLWHEIDLPALASVNTSASNGSYPLRGTLKRLLSPLPSGGGSSSSAVFADGMRLNGESRSFQLGVALITAVGTLPIIVWLEGGEY